MNELQTTARQLPDAIEDLSKFVIVGRAKLKAVRALIKDIDKVGLAKEVYEQKLAEAQDIADAVLDAEVKIGELTSKIPKATADNARKQINNGVELIKPKAQALEEIGIPQHTAERFERLAAHPETVQKAKEDARAEGRIVTRQDVLNRIVAPKKKLDIVKMAKEEHEQFEEDKKESVVSFRDIQDDKENVEIINLSEKVKLMQLLNKIDYLTFMEVDALNEMISSLTNEERSSFINHINRNIDALTIVRQKMEVANGRL